MSDFWPLIDQGFASQIHTIAAFVPAVWEEACMRDSGLKILRKLVYE